MHGATCPHPHMPSWNGAELIARTALPSRARDWWWV